MASVLEAVLSCGVLVQGCWVVASQVLYPDPSDTAKRTARDYMVRLQSTQVGPGILGQVLNPDLSHSAKGNAWE